mmetsp:Transcript_43655/g.109531  ORF Transcript_43655/g.109531 Transcript_43655/m.109531 type:complete len:270 (+) Transcript_43655:180-989(+)
MFLRWNCERHVSGLTALGTRILQCGVGDWDVVLIGIEWRQGMPSHASGADSPVGTAQLELEVGIVVHGGRWGRRRWRALRVIGAERDPLRDEAGQRVGEQRDEHRARQLPPGALRLQSLHLRLSYLRHRRHRRAIVGGDLRSLCRPRRFCTLRLAGGLPGGVLAHAARRRHGGRHGARLAGLQGPLPPLRLLQLRRRLDHQVRQVDGLHVAVRAKKVLKAFELHDDSHGGGVVLVGVELGGVQPHRLDGRQHARQLRVRLERRVGVQRQ